MSKNKIYLKINKQDVDTLEDVDFNFRLNRIVSDIQNFQMRGGDYTTDLDIPYTKNNIRVFGITFNNNAINKFNREVPYNFVLGINGFELIRGTCLLESISKSFIQVSFVGQNIDWVNLLDDVSLNRLGYVNNLPTWFGSNKLGQVFEGGKTISIVNELNQSQTDYICPMIVRYNTPLTDYLPYAEADIFGLYDGGGNQVLQPLDFPNVFRTVRGFFGSRQGLTFMDLPPALFYRSVLEKCFEEVGYNIDCSLFNEDWFNRLYIPYQGEDFYKYNWKTLAELKVFVNVSNTINDFYFNIITKSPAEPVLDYTDSNFTMIAYPFNLCIGDDPIGRVDRIANYKKFLVTDDDYGYVVPTNGKYRITVNSKFTRGMTDRGGELINLATLFGNGNPNYGWDDNMFMIVRQNQNGEYPLNPNYVADAMNFMNGTNSEFTESPSDIVAYVSPKRCALLGNNNVQASGSPLTNFQEHVNIISTSHTIDIFSLTEFKSTSSANFSIDVDLLQNERLNFYCLGIIDYATASPIVNGAVNMIYMSRDGSVTHFEVVIEYLCGDEDISLADNLPEMSSKDFIKSFMNTFNLRFSVNDKTVRFLTESEFYNNNIPYDVTPRVDVNSIKYTSLSPKTNISIGYENDDTDFELNAVISECISDINQATNYGIKIFDDNPNLYSEGTESFINGFSATKFIEADLSGCIDYNTITKTLSTIPNPITSDLFTKGIVWGTKNNYAMFRMQVPSIQSIESVSESTVGDLNYTFNQSLRLLQYYGTVGSIYYTNGAVTEDYRFKIDAAEFAIADDIDWWIRPTISSFDLQTPYYPVYSVPSNTNVPTQSMRYDVTNGLYDNFFGDVIDIQNKSYILSCEAYLTSKDWNMLQANRIVKLNECLYRLIEISDYDITGTEPCNITLVKII